MALQDVHSIMQELGFQKGSNEAVQVAFIKSLIRKSCGVEVKAPLKLYREENLKRESEQLSFNFDADRKTG